jgi:hypothetical protein
MMPAANQGVGMNMGFPDVCMTPAVPSPVPIPYPNIGMNAMAMPFVPNILVSMAPAQNMTAKPLMTNGDNAGVAHPLCMQPGGTLMGNPRILMGGMPALLRRPAHCRTRRRRTPADRPCRCPHHRMDQRSAVLRRHGRLRPRGDRR